jgi:hypothetical protein
MKSIDEGSKGLDLQQGDIPTEDQHGPFKPFKKWKSLQNSMTRTELLFLEDKLNETIFKKALDSIRLMSHNNHGFFGFNPVKGKVDSIGEHGNP